MTTDPFRDRDPMADDDAIQVLTEGEIEILGRMPWSSNGTFLCNLELDGVEVQGIYKPLEGERPLWDFPEGLYQREVGTYQLSRHMGWDLVPPTVLRDGELGIGSLQLAIPARFEEHFFTLVEDDQHKDAFQRLCVFDVICNQTDRKGGHCLVDKQDHIWAIDNGLSFHSEFKLRTVIWNWSGEYIPAEILSDVQTLLEDGLPDELNDMLDSFEKDALKTRARALVREGSFPVDHTGRRHPWPLV